MTQNWLQLQVYIIAFGATVLSGCGAGDNRFDVRVWGGSSVVSEVLHVNEKALIYRLINEGPLDDQINNVVSEYFQSTQLHIVSTSHMDHISSRSGFSSRDYDVLFEDVPIYGAQIRLFTDVAKNNSFALVHFPLSQVVVGDDSFVDESSLHQNIIGAMDAAGLGKTDYSLNQEKDIWYISEDKKLHRAKLVDIEVEQLHYYAIITRNMAVDFFANFFDATGSARVYASNPADGTLADFSLPDLIGDGTLENDFFTTSTTGEKADESTHQFIYSSSDGRFDETSLFVHANEQLNFFEDMGYTWPNADKLNIYVHAVVQGSVNNALYTPASGSNPPRIQVGDGDGIRLKNLPQDADVVRHELGHHIVYDTLKSTRGESLVLHEGLADFFAFAFSGDACLGESICPENSPIGCEVAAQCLRSGDNDYVLDKNTKSEAHFKSQFISGYLWDLRADLGEDIIQQLVFDATRMLLSESGYHDFVLALLIAENDSTKGENCQKIYDAAVARGMGNLISDFGCGKDLKLDALDNAGTTQDSSAPTTTTKTSRSGGSAFGCGTLGHTTDHAGFLSFAIGVISPFFYALLRRRRNPAKTT